MKVLVTGANGFLGTHLVETLSKIPNIDVLTYIRSDEPNSLYSKLAESDFTFHLAGVNRPEDNNEFLVSNIQLTANIKNFLLEHKIKSPIYFSSSIHAESLSDYGVSKLRGEIILDNLFKKNGNKIINDRLPGIFGPKARPNYNSVVSTFCYAIANKQLVHISDRHRVIDISYVGDWVNRCLNILNRSNDNFHLPIYQISLEDLYDILVGLRENKNLNFSAVDKKLIEYLHKTYSYYEIFTKE